VWQGESRSESESPQVTRGVLRNGDQSHESDPKPARSIREQGEANLIVGGGPQPVLVYSAWVTHA
jgi:hypothetical protein